MMLSLHSASKANSNDETQPKKYQLKTLHNQKKAKVIKKLTPGTFMANAIPGYVMPYTVEKVWVIYDLTIAKIHTDKHKHLYNILYKYDIIT